MRIGGWVKFSLCDYPGTPAAVVFTQGCNFRCPFCHNGPLIPRRVPPGRLIPEAAVLDFLSERRGELQGLVISGGEPTLQADLDAFLRRVRRLGYLAKLDTNGSRPDVLRRLLSEHLLDYVAMDVKAPARAYVRLTGRRALSTDAIASSIRCIASSGVAHEFRTTWVKPLLTPDDLRDIRRMLPDGSAHRVQPFRPETALDPALRRGRAPGDTG